MQKSVLKQYLDLYNNPTLRVMSKDTGIQLTRIFRLLNGSRMKVAEYEIFKKRVNDKIGDGASLEKLALDCSTKLSVSGIREIETLMERKLRLQNLLGGKVS